MDIKSLQYRGRHIAILDSQGNIWESGQNCVPRMGKQLDDHRLELPTDPVGLEALRFLDSSNSRYVFDNDKGLQKFDMQEVEKMGVGQAFTIALREEKVYHRGLIRYFWGKRRREVYNTKPTLLEMPNPVIDIQADDFRVILLDNQGLVWFLGNQKILKLGVGIEGKEWSVPRKVLGIPKIQQIALNNGGGVVLALDGSVFSWGDNPAVFGLGDDVEYPPAPEKIPGMPAIEQLKAGGRIAIGLEGNHVWQWGCSNGSQWEDANYLTAQPNQLNLPEGMVKVAILENQVVAEGVSGKDYIWGFEQMEETPQSRALSLKVIPASWVARGVVSTATCKIQEPSEIDIKDRKVRQIIFSPGSRVRSIEECESIVRNILKENITL